MTEDTKTPITRRPSGAGEYGIRRADGQPWRTEPSALGKFDYYSADNDEATSDALVLPTDTILSLAGMVVSQRDDADVPHPGTVVPVVAAYLRHDDSWDYWYVDMTPEELVRRLANEAQGIVRALVDLHTPATPEETD